MNPAPLRHLAAKAPKHVEDDLPRWIEGGVAEPQGMRALLKDWIVMVLAEPEAFPTPRRIAARLLWAGLRYLLKGA